MSAAAREVEAILLVSGRPVPVHALAAAAGRPKEEVEAAVSELEERYGPGRSGIVLRRVGGGYQLATGPESSEAVEGFRKEARPSPLSGAAHEVLACVLYLGPMTRGAVSKVRGVNSDAVARSLIERGLIAESGFDADAPGTPALLDLTEEFHIATGSSTRADFPPLDSLVNDEELNRVRERNIAPEASSTEPHSSDRGNFAETEDPSSQPEAPSTDPRSGEPRPDKIGDSDETEGSSSQPESSSGGASSGESGGSSAAEGSHDQPEPSSGESASNETDSGGTSP